MKTTKNKKSDAAAAEIKKLRQEIALLKKNKIAADKDLKINEEKFRKLSDSAFEGIVIHQNGKVMDVNKALCRTFGFTEKQLIGQPIIKYVHPDYHQIVIDKVRKNDTNPYQVIMFRKGKKQFWVELVGNQITYKGNPARVTAIRDITAQKENESIAKESERKFSVLIDNFPGIAYRCKLDAKLTMLYLSNGFHKLTGYNPLDFINNKKKAFNDIIYPEDTGNKKLKKALDKKNVYELEYRIISANGEIKWVWEKGQGVFDEKGKLLFLEGFIADINEKKLYELKSKQSQENYKRLFDYSPDGVIIHIDGKIIFSNKAALKILAVKHFRELENKSAFDFILPEYHQETLARIVKVKKGVDLDFAEIKIKNKAGQIKILETKSVPIEFNGLSAVQVVFHDTTEQKALIKEQMRAHIAEESNQKLQKEIDERKKTERTLSENQKYTRLLIESSLDMICASDKKGNIIEFNKAAQKTFGYKSEEVIGKHISILYANPNERTHITEKELYEKGTYAGEVENVKKNGDYFISFLSASVLKDESGKIVGAMGVSRDISEIKKAQEELKESEERYRAIYNQAYIGIASIGFDGNIQHANQRFCQILGYDQEELQQMNHSQIIHPEDFVSFPQKEIFLENHIDNLNAVERYIHKNGSIVFARLTISMVRDASGKPSYCIAVFQDITEHRKTEKEQQNQAAKLKAIFDSGSHLIWTVDKNFCLTSFNKNFAMYISEQYNVEATFGLSMVSGPVFSNESYNNYWIKKYNATLTGVPQYFETKPFDTSGNPVWYEMFLNPIFDKEKNVLEISGIGHDITEKIKSSEKIQQSLQEKEVLLKEVHHRVKNNLQVISSILNLQSSYVKDQNTLNILKESQNRIKSMAFIHESLYQTKDFSSINFSEYLINLSQNLVHTYSSTSHQIKLFLNIATIYLNLDLAIPCGLIVNEIISNSIKYAFSNKDGKNEIEMELKSDGDTITLSIGDNGVGLPPDIDFRNTESLGLQLVITLVDQLNGDIQVENKKGTKYIIIHLIKINLKTEYKMAKTNILIVEDESIVAKDIQHSLKKLGYTIVETCSNGEDAVKAAEELKPDLVLMDIMLKGEMSGIEAASIIREKLNIPIIYLTAYADESTLAKAKVSEPYGYIIKPFKEIDLHTSIEMAIYKHEKETDLKKERDFLYSIVENKESKDLIFVKSNSRLIKVKTHEIHFVEALKDYVVLKTTKEHYVIHSTMKDMEKKLSASDFIRVHRSYIVRIDKIIAIDAPNLILEDRLENKDNKENLIPIGGSYKETLTRRLNTM